MKIPLNHSSQRLNGKGFMKFLFILSCLFSTSVLSAREFIKIDIGQDYQKYSTSDLQKRVWELERAVDQLQEKVSRLERSGRNTSHVIIAAPEKAPERPAEETWLCTVNTVNSAYSGTGTTKAIASKNALENCKKARNDDGFFCKNPTCEQ